MDQPTTAPVTPKHKKVEIKSLIIGFLTGIIITVAVIVIIAFISTRVPSAIADYNTKETEFLNLDSKFTNEYQNMYPSDSSSDLVLNDSLASANKSKEYVFQIRTKVDELVKITSESDASGKTKDWFKASNQCYVIRQDIYAKYDKVLDSQITLIKLAQTENTATKILDEIAGVAKEISSYTASKDKAHLISSIDQSIINLARFSNSISAMKKIVQLPSLDGWIAYADKATELMNVIKTDVQQVGFTDTVTASDQDIIRRSVELRNKRTEVSTQYGKEVGSWIFNNRDSIQKDIDRKVIEANQACNNAFSIYQTLFPNN